MSRWAFVGVAFLAYLAARVLVAADRAQCVCVAVAAWLAYSLCVGWYFFALLDPSYPYFFWFKRAAAY